MRSEFLTYSPVTKIGFINTQQLQAQHMHEFQCIDQEIKIIFL